MTDKKNIKFKKLCAGLYVNLEWDMVIAHDLVWKKIVGRKWVAKWKTCYLHGFEQQSHNKSFNTMAEARAFLNALR